MINKTILSVSPLSSLLKQKEIKKGIFFVIQIVVGEPGNSNTKVLMCFVYVSNQYSIILPNCTEEQVRFGVCL